MITALIVVGRLCIGGAERVCRNIGYYADPEQFQIDYLVFGESIGDYEAELEEKGCRIWHMPLPSAGYFGFYRRIKKLCVGIIIALEAGDRSEVSEVLNGTDSASWKPSAPRQSAAAFRFGSHIPTASGEKTFGRRSKMLMKKPCAGGSCGTRRIMSDAGRRQANGCSAGVRSGIRALYC